MATSTTLHELMKLGEILGYEGAELRDFVREQQTKEREEREKERERLKEEREFQRQQRKEEREEKEMEYQHQKEEREAQVELEKMKLEIEIKKMEVQVRLEEASTGSHGEAPIVSDDDRDFIPPRSSANEPRVRIPNISPFEEKHDLDAYLYRFERYAELQGWSRDSWAIYLAALLKGKALAVYAHLTPEQSMDYDILKSALLKRYELTEEGYKTKFYEAKPEVGESHSQFVVRLENYFIRWSN